MSRRDWADPDTYAFAASLDGGQWAWGFLRRNPDYQAEWRAVPFQGQTVVMVPWTR